MRKNIAAVLCLVLLLAVGMTAFAETSWGFEDGASDILLNLMTGEITKETSRSGAASGKISYDEDVWISGAIIWLQNTVPYTKYELSVWVKVTERLDYDLSVELEVAPGMFMQTQLTRKTIDPQDGWVELKGVFDTEDSITITPCIEASKPKTVFYIDDVSLVEQEALNDNGLPPAEQGGADNMPLVLLDGSISPAQLPNNTPIKQITDNKSPALQEGTKVRVISNGFANIRSKGSTKGNIIAQAHNGDVLTSTGRAYTGWYIILLPDGRTGYISDQLVVPIQ